MQTIELSITGMMCGACQNHVTTALQNLAGTQAVKVDLASGTATITGNNLDSAQLIEAVEEEGYSAQIAVQSA